VKIDTVKGHNVPYGTSTPQGFPLVQMQIIVCVKNLGKPLANQVSTLFALSPFVSLNSASWFI